jgi:hypothetical protein
LAAFGAVSASRTDTRIVGSSAAQIPDALPASSMEHLPLQSPIAGLLVNRRRALTPLTDDSMAGEQCHCRLAVIQGSSCHCNCCTDRGAVTARYNILGNVSLVTNLSTRRLNAEVRPTDALQHGNSHATDTCAQPPPAIRYVCCQLNNALAGECTAIAHAQLIFTMVSAENDRFRGFTMSVLPNRNGVARDSVPAAGLVGQRRRYRAVRWCSSTSLRHPGHDSPTG